MECKDAGEKLWSFGEDAEKEKEREESGARGGRGGGTVQSLIPLCRVSPSWKTAAKGAVDKGWGRKRKATSPHCIPAAL